MESGDRPLIRMEGISKVYDTGDVAVWALKRVDFHVDKGDFVAIMGASGSGKSTLMNLLGCLDRPSTGRYWLAGQDVYRTDTEGLAEIRNRRIGFVFQSFNLLARTSAAENVELPLIYAGVPARIRRQHAVQALQRVGLGERMNHHPSQLSGGQQQRVAIARALVMRPSLILADEPTGNLDSHTSLEVMALFQELGRDGITVVIVTHEPDIAEFASRIVVMRDGEIRSDTRHSAKDAASAIAERQEVGHP